MTLNIMKLNIMKLNIMTQSIMTFSLKTVGLVPLCSSSQRLPSLHKIFLISSLFLSDFFAKTGKSDSPVG